MISSIYQFFVYLLGQAGATASECNTFDIAAEDRYFQPTEDRVFAISSEDRYFRIEC